MLGLLISLDSSSGTFSPVSVGAWTVVPRGVRQLHLTGVPDVGLAAPGERVRFIADGEHDVSWNFVRALVFVIFPLECDLRAGIASGSDVNDEDLVFATRLAVWTDHFPRDVHLLGAALSDVLQGDV